MKEYQLFLNRLNEYQKRAVYDESDACLVNANVGSGKTTVLIAKILYLHYQKNVSYSDMVVLTFTNKAADEIRERLVSYEQELKAEDMPWFGTFHGVALKMLKEILPVFELGYTKDFHVIDPDEEMEVGLKLIKENELKIRYKNRLKNRLELMRKSKSHMDKDADFITLVHLLEEKLLGEDKMNFHDLIVNATRLLPSSDFSPSWILVDEVQDSDAHQIDMLSAIKKKGARMFAVGDPNQVIYSWRGSLLNVFSNLKNDFGAKEYSLPINYRSTDSIIGAAHVFKEQGETLIGSGQTGELIRIREQYDSFQDADHIVEKILDTIASDSNVSYRDFAILFRMQSQAEIYEKAFKKAGIPYQIKHRNSIKENAVLYWFYKILTFSVHLEDRLSAESVLTNKLYGPGFSVKKAEKIINTILEETETGIPSKIKCERPVLLEKMIHFQKKFTEYVSSNPSQTDLEKWIWNDFNLREFLMPSSSTYQQDEKDIFDMIHYLVDGLPQEKVPLNLISDRLNEISLKGRELWEKEENENAVSLLTLHASKGLEFSYVYIVGVNPGILPARNKNLDDMDEERRLFYVGLTRAKKHLCLTYYTNPDHYGAMGGPSRFLNMLPKELVDDDGRIFTKTSLKELSKMVQVEKNQMKMETENDQKEMQVQTRDSAFIDDADPEEKDVKTFTHEHYGVGNIIAEDDFMITVDFPEYGEKEFVKAFL